MSFPQKTPQQIRDTVERLREEHLQADRTRAGVETAVQLRVEERLAGSKRALERPDSSSDPAIRRQRQDISAMTKSVLDTRAAGGAAPRSFTALVSNILAKEASITSYASPLARAPLARSAPPTITAPTGAPTGPTSPKPTTALPQGRRWVWCEVTKRWIEAPGTSV
jgi:hypothetical protein